MLVELAWFTNKSSFPGLCGDWIYEFIIPRAAMDLNPGEKNVENTLCQKVSCIKVAWTAHEGIFMYFKGKSFPRLKPLIVLLEVPPSATQLWRWWRGDPSLNWLLVMEALVCQHQGGVVQWWRSVSGTLIIDLSVQGSFPALRDLPWHRGSGAPATPRSKSANFFLSARKLGFKEVVWGLMLRKKWAGGGNPIPSPWAAWLCVTCRLSDGF